MVHIPGTTCCLLPHGDKPIFVMIPSVRFFLLILILAAAILRYKEETVSFISR